MILGKMGRIAASSCAIAIGLGAGVMSPALASNTNLGTSPSAAQIELWEMLDVSAPQIKKLAQKVSSGVTLDADKEDRSAVSRDIETVAGYIETTETFEDGSVAFSFIETPEAIPLEASDEVKMTIKLVSNDKSYLPIAHPASVGSCLGGNSGSGYATWRDCRVAGTSGSVSIYFRATYTIVNGGYDTITDTNSPSHFVEGGTATRPYLKINRPKETASAGAQATAKTVFTRWSGSSSEHVLALNVRGNTAWTSWV